MKIKKVILLISTLVVIPCLSACHDEKDMEDEEHNIYDGCAGTIELWVSIVNSSGQDLLNKDVDGNILDEKMTVTFKEFPRDVAMTKPDGEVAKSRSIPPKWYGAYIRQTNMNEKINVIAIGEYDGELSTTETMTLDICGQKHILSFTNSYYEKKDYVNRNFFLDGVLIQSGSSSLGKYTITLNR